jgi:hypothetical protein
MIHDGRFFARFMPTVRTAETGKIPEVGAGDMFRLHHHLTGAPAPAPVGRWHLLRRTSCAAPTARAGPRVRGLWHLRRGGPRRFPALVPHPSQAADALRPSEDLLDALPDALADLLPTTFDESARLSS